MIRRYVTSHRSALVAALLAVACSSGSVVDPTQTLVVIDAERGVQGLTQALQVTVTSLDDEQVTLQETPRRGGKLRFPYVLSLVPKGGDASRRFEVVATARGGDDELVAQVRARSGYREHKQLRLSLLLQDACIGVQCKDDETCKSGGCDSAEVPVSGLLPFDEDELPEAGVAEPVLDAAQDAQADAAPRDAEADAAVGTDAAVSDGCTPNPDTEDEACTQICPEVCNGQDDDCDLRIDEDADATCVLEHATALCSKGKCEIKACEPSYRDCDQKPETGCEAGEGDLLNCGKCGQVCDFTHAAELCVQGTCIQLSCEPLWGDCTGERMGCNTPLNTLSDCAQCGRECENVPHATPSCESGSCGVGACDHGYGDCDLDGDDGCEEALDTLSHCGACDVPCDFAGSTGDDCGLGTCVAGACEGGYADCDGDGTDGCESLSGDADCGGCGKKCDGTLTNVQQAGCQAGACTVTTCDTGFGDCDGDAFNGCEASTRTLLRCGGCASGCARPNAVMSCGMGSCVFVACQDGYGDCDSDPGNGCEQALDVPAHCGGCTASCGGVTPYCSGGKCASLDCPAGTGDCDNAGGSCETDTSSSAQHCGACGNACAFAAATPNASGLLCQSSKCQPVCNAGFADCNGSYADGCETSLRTLTDCGACSIGCALANATATCVNQVCEVDSCATDLGNCDGNNADCETPLYTTTDCGSCSAGCNLPHAVESCGGAPGARACEVAACDDGFGDCDGAHDNGCETDLQAAQNCWGCASLSQNLPCTNLPNVASSSCPGGACTIGACAADWADCDGDVQNGCEQQLSVVGPCFPDTGCTKQQSGGRNYFFCSNARTFGAARAQCQSQLLGDLVHIDDATENAFLVTNTGADAWVGASDSAVEGSFKWVNDNSALSYTNWNTGEPNDAGGNEDCVSLRKTDGKWNDLVCSTTQRFVCEVQADLCPDDPQKSFPGQCGCGTPDTDGDGDGTADCNDQCGSDPNKTAPGACGCGVGDSDGDGTEDCAETCDNDPNKLAPALCGCGVPDTNTDGDSQPDCNESCDSDPNKLAPGTCGCGVADTNTDGDSQPDCAESCDNDPGKLAPGICGCGTADTDTDGDGTANCNDLCPNNAPKTAPGQCGCGTADTDTDGDGTANCNDQCPNNAPKTAPGICGCAVPDTDTDGDSQPDCNETCDSDPNKLAPGVCGCGVADTNTDGDSQPDCSETCDSDPNKVAPGLCGCGVADTNTDGDSQPDCNETCDNDPNKVAPGACGCGVPDTNTDGDSQPDCNEACDSDPLKLAPGLCGCGVADTNTDGDSQPDCSETCDSDPSKLAPGLCGCGVSDADGDGDGFADCMEVCDADPNKQDPGDCGCGVVDTDSDGDGAADCVDGCVNDPATSASCAFSYAPSNFDPAQLVWSTAPATTLDTGCSGGTVTFNTDTLAFTGWCGPLPVPVVFGQSGYSPGLRYGKLTAWDTVTANPANLAADPLGPSITELDTEVANGPNERWVDGTTYVYSGEIYITASGVGSFMEHIDDNVYLKIDSTVVLNDTNWSTPTAGKFAGAPGWHTFELRLYDGTGGQGIAVSSLFGTRSSFGREARG